MGKIPVRLIFIFTIALLSASFTLAAGNNAGPPFKPGEVVVVGAPGSHLAGLEIVKYLPHAEITVVKVEKGREVATAQRFKARGRKASLNYIVHAADAPNAWNASRPAAISGPYGTARPLPRPPKTWA